MMESLCSNFSSQGGFHETFRDTGSYASAPREELDDTQGLPPTQRLSQVSSLYLWCASRC